MLEYEHRPGAWPWPYHARQSFVLSHGALAITLEVENLAEVLMPAGLGFRTCFARTPEATLTARTSGVWRTGPDMMPTERTSVPAEWDLAAGRRVAGLELDNVFTGWDGRASVSWPEHRARLALEGERPILSFLAIQARSTSDFFCAEPASHCADAINLARTGVPDTGLRVLAPGARRGATLVLRPELA